MVTAPIADMLIQIKNAQMVGKDHVLLPFSKMKLAVATILKESGIVDAVEKKSRKVKNSEHDYLDITLKYDGKLGALNGVKMISRPSRRMYIKAEEIKPVRSGYGFSIISTSKGVMSSKDAFKQKIGGEILCEVW